MTKHENLFASLAAAFDPQEVKDRTQAGRKLQYITARTAMNRLDNVLGPENWWDDYVPAEKSVLCKLTIRLPDGSTLTKQDAGGYAGMADSGDDEKSGFSDAFKRACAKFGVGRYLYRDGVPSFVEGSAPQPSTPARSIAPPAAAPARSTNPQTTNDIARLPRPGKGVFAWAKELENRYQTSVVSGMAAKGKELGAGTKFTEWDEATVKAVCLDAVAFIKTLDNYDGAFDNISVHTDACEAGGAPAATTETPKARAARLVQAVASAYCGGEPTPDQVREALASLSATAANGRGHAGEVMESLARCDDAVWVANLTLAAEQTLKSLAAAHDAKDDIPF